MRSKAALEGNPEPTGVALGLRRWKNKSKAERVAHMRMMARCRWGASAKVSSKSPDK